MGVELILNSANINYLAFARYGGASYDGQVFAIFVIMLAAAEAAIGLAIVLGIYQTFHTIDVEATDTLRVLMQMRSARIGHDGASLGAAVRVDLDATSRTCVRTCAGSSLLPLFGAAINGLGGALIQKAASASAPSASLACDAGAGSRSRSSVAASCSCSGSRPSSASCSTDVHLDRRRQPARRRRLPARPALGVMILVVTGVGGLIHIYSTAYMHEEPAYWRLLRLPEPLHLRDADAGPRPTTCC